MIEQFLGSWIFFPVTIFSVIFSTYIIVKGTSLTTRLIKAVKVRIAEYRMSNKTVSDCFPNTFPYWMPEDHLTYRENMYNDKEGHLVAFHSKMVIVRDLDSQQKLTVLPAMIRANHTAELRKHMMAAKKYEKDVMPEVRGALLEAHDYSEEDLDLNEDTKNVTVYSGQVR